MKYQKTAKKFVKKVYPTYNAWILTLFTSKEAQLNCGLHYVLTFYTFFYFYRFLLLNPSFVCALFKKPWVGFSRSLGGPQPWVGFSKCLGGIFHNPGWSFLSPPVYEYWPSNCRRLVPQEFYSFDRIFNVQIRK